MAKVATNAVFDHIELSESRIVVEQGGTRSGKTYNILIWILSYIERYKHKTVTICRKTYPSLRATAMRDFIEIMTDANMYHKAVYNKSTSEIHYNSNLVEFISIDAPTKIRGRKRDILFINEANELTLEDWRQLTFRTTEKIIIDYNPSMQFHWIYDDVLTRDDCEFHKTTYKDNPFLEPELVKEIERLRDVDEWYWSVYGLGDAMASQEIILHAEVINDIPKEPDGEPIKPDVYGLDFGYTNSSTCLVACYKWKDGYIAHEMIYGTGLSNRDIIKQMDDHQIDKHAMIYADPAEPKSIDEIAAENYNILPAIKGSDSVRTGISYLQQNKIYVTAQSLNLIKEFRNYKWKVDKDGIVLNEPVKLFDHGMDAFRYGVYSMFGIPLYGTYHVR